MTRDVKSTKISYLGLILTTQTYGRAVTESTTATNLFHSTENTGACNTRPSACRCQASTCTHRRQLKKVQPHTHTQRNMLKQFKHEHERLGRCSSKRKGQRIAAESASSPPKKEGETMEKQHKCTDRSMK